jgi:hypothetical protein
MGHVRLGRLPASKKWRQVVGYLLSGDADVAGLANQVAEASARSLQKVATDRGLIGYCRRLRCSRKTGPEKVAMVGIRSW